jgi:hypothetical protein
VELHSRSSTDGAVDNNTNIQRHILWDRKVEGGFPGVFFLNFHYLTISAVTSLVTSPCCLLQPKPH